MKSDVSANHGGRNSKSPSLPKSNEWPENGKNGQNQLFLETLETNQKPFIKGKNSIKKNEVNLAKKSESCGILIYQARLPLPRAVVVLERTARISSAWREQKGSHLQEPPSSCFF